MQDSWFTKVSLGTFADWSMYDRALALALIIFFVLLTRISFSTQQYFVYQADGFLHGSVFYHTLPLLMDAAPGLGGHYYWPLGPFPLLLLLPLVALFGLIPLQGIVQLGVTILTLGLCFRLARRFEYNVANSLWLAFAFVFGSVYLGIAFSGGTAWQLATAISTALLLVTFDEYFARRRYWLMGLYLACAFATRFTAGLAVVFVAADLLLSTEVAWAVRLKQLLRLLTPIVCVGLALLWLNYARTGNLWDNGYRSAMIGPATQVEARTRYGLFSFQNIPTNIFYYFLMPPKPLFEHDTLRLVPPYFTVNLGLGFFFLSPLFLFMFRAPWRERKQRLVWLCSGLILFVLLTYYATDYYQFGTYYLGDVLPLWYLLLLWAFPSRQIGVRGRLLAALPALYNFYLLVVYYLMNVH